YAGQGYELEVPAPNGPLDVAALAALRSRFDARHEALHGHRAEAEPVEIVNYRLRVVVAVPKFEPRPLPAASRRGPDGQRQPAIFAPDGAPRETAVYDRLAVEPGTELIGPAILHQPDATTVVPPGWRCEVDDLGNLVLSPAAP